MMEMQEFIDRYLQDPKSCSWLQPARIRGKTEAMTWLCAKWEIEGRKWDVLGADEEQKQYARRRAREIAASLSGLTID